MTLGRLGFWPRKTALAMYRFLLSFPTLKAPRTAPPARPLLQASPPSLHSLSRREDALVQLDVFDILGRHVASLARGTWPAGKHVVEWTGQEPGGMAPPGLYFVRYRFPGGQQHRRLVWAR